MRHKTSTTDHSAVPKGGSCAIMEIRETLPEPGDVLAQRGTMHSRSMRGDELCAVAVAPVNATRI